MQWRRSFSGPVERNTSFSKECNSFALCNPVWDCGPRREYDRENDEGRVAQLTSVLSRIPDARGASAEPAEAAERADAAQVVAVVPEPISVIVRAEELSAGQRE